MNKRLLANQAGQSLIMFILLVDAVVLVALWSFMHFTEQQANARLNFVKRFLVEETVSSSFEVMEAALRRRLWESPPDSSCRRSTSFTVDGMRSDLKLKWNVTASYNATNHLYDLSASGGYYSDPILKTLNPSLKAAFHKQVKVLDASDFLVLNTGTQPLNVARTYESSAPAGLIAGPRRLYLKGQMAVNAVMLPNQQARSFAPVGSNFNYYGIIVQGERIQIAGGIRYVPSYTVQEPDPASCANLPGLCAALAPYLGTRYQGQNANGAVLFFGAGADLTLATTLNNDEKACGGGLNCAYPSDLNMAEVKKHVYPVALFGGASRPLISSSATDTGAYLNDPDAWSIFLYNYTANHWGMVVNNTCLLDNNDPNPECSNSERFPKGFNRWRTNAGLDGVLFTHETADISASPLDWDNYQALLEDAQYCGKVVNAGDSPSYEDCPVWDRNYLNAFVSAGGGSAPACPKVTKVSLDGNIFPRFNDSDYTDDSLKDRLLRRVIYAKGPIELAQTNVQGLRPAMTNATERGRLTIWVVGEDFVALRGNEDGDPTPPSSGNYDRLRKVSFNSDGSAAGNFPAMRMVVLSPELVHLVSPTYVPMSSTHFLASYGVRGGYLYPKIPSMFDDSRWENDGFKFGMRSFQLKNMVVIGNSTQSASLLAAADGFFLKGMWSGWDSSAEQYLHNQCLFNRDGQPATDPSAPGPGPGPGPVAAGQHQIYPGFMGNQDYLGNYPVNLINPSGSTYVPPTSSAFYQHDPDGSTWVPFNYYPYVLTAQMYATQSSSGTRESNIQYTGLHLQVNFDPTHSATQRDLSTSKYAVAETASVNLDDKKFEWQGAEYWTNVGPPGQLCKRDSIKFLDGTTAYITNGDYDYVNNYYHVNFGKHVFQHSSPDVNLSDLGSLFGVDLPMVETRE